MKLAIECIILQDLYDLFKSFNFIIHLFDSYIIGHWLMYQDNNYKRKRVGLFVVFKQTNKKPNKQNKTNKNTPLVMGRMFF